MHAGVLPADIAQLPRLAVFNADSNQLSGTLDSFGDAVAAANGKGNLKTLILSKNELTGAWVCLASAVPAVSTHLRPLCAQAACPRR